MNNMSHQVVHSFLITDNVVFNMPYGNCGCQLILYIHNVILHNRSSSRDE